MSDKKTNELAKLQKKYPAHSWVYRDYLVYCGKCGMSSVTPHGECRPWKRAVSYA